MTGCSQKKITIILALFFISIIITPSIIANSSQTNDTIQITDDIHSQGIDSDGEQGYYAIIIGIEDFNTVNSEEENIDETALSFYNKLISGPNWHEENVKLILNEGATKSNIKSAIIDWLDPLESKEDIVLFYFIGKTKKMPFSEIAIGNTYSIPYDASNYDYAEDKITDKELDTWFDTLESDHISLVFDTSYASYMLALKQFGRSFLASTGFLFPNQKFENPASSYSMTTHFLMKGLDGYADQDDNGIISVSELFTYAKNQCVEYSFTHIFDFKDNYRLSLQIPQLFDRHWGSIPLFTLPFGWKQLTDNGFGKNSNFATRGLEIFNGELYIGTQNMLFPNSMSLEQQQIGLAATSVFPDYFSLWGELTRLPVRVAVHFMTFASQGCEIWKYNYSTDALTKVIGSDSISGISAGFDYHFNAAASILKEFKGHLYVGTWNTPIGSVLKPDRKGCEIWRSSDGIHWQQVVGHNAPYAKGGFGNPDNSGAWSIEEFNGQLYVGTMNWDFSDTGGCEVWRSSDGLVWEQVVDHGYKPLMSDDTKKAINTYAWAMEVFQDELYMGTFNSRLWLFNEEGTGCQLWKTKDGASWEKVDLPDGMGGYQDGFGEGENYGIRRMVIYNDELYFGIASSFFHNHGCEIWKFDGVNWTPIISDEISGISPTDKRYDGFGTTFNKYIWSMTVTNDNKLWVGTANGQVFLPIISKGDDENDLFSAETHGCEIWCFDGENWDPVIKNDVGLKPNGLGDMANLGARSMIEYPADSNNIIVGTFKFINPFPGQPREGCELWMRYNHIE